MGFEFAEARPETALISEVRSGDQSWREVAHLHYAEVMLARAARAAANLSRRCSDPSAVPTSNDVKAVVELLWDAAVVLVPGARLHPDQQVHAEAMWRLLKTATEPPQSGSNDGERR